MPPMWKRDHIRETLARPLIGMVHCRPLPGSPGFAGDMAAVETAALYDAEALAIGGAGAVMVENYHDTPFFAGHDETVLDTSPWSVATHWRQTVLYLVNPLKMLEGETATIKMKSGPNKANPRDLDITIHVDFDGRCQTSHFDQDFRLR